jgi:hypothetical protein
MGIVKSKVAVAEGGKNSMQMSVSKKKVGNK